MPELKDITPEWLQDHIESIVEKYRPDECPTCGGKMFYRQYDTPVNGKVIHAKMRGCQNCHTATMETDNVA